MADNYIELKKYRRPKIRCFVIADDFRWHVLTNSIMEFQKYSLAYLDLMNRSEKENHYYFKNIFMEEDEYYQTLKQMKTSQIGKNERVSQPTEKRQRPDLTLIK